MSRKKPLPITNGDEPVKTDLPLEDDFDDGEQAGDESVSGLEPLSFRLDDEVIGQRLWKVVHVGQAKQA